MAQTEARPGQSEDLKLNTKDGVELGVTYYPSNQGKEAVPVVMLHDYKETRAVFGGLARELQNPVSQGLKSHAVLTVDLRGHGASKTQVGRNGQTRQLEADRLSTSDYRAMVLGDMEAVRQFLRSKNDSGELNLNKLCLIGSGMGANVAASYAEYDWSVPPLANVKQGQDVKALILAAPKRNSGGLSIMNALKHPGVRQYISVLLVYGEEDSAGARDTKNVHKLLSKYHEMPPPDQRREQQDLFLFGLPTSLKGTRLLTDPNFAMLPKLDVFLDARLVRQDFEWIQRIQ
ncbi:MAG: alpha/beta fold hydrolase [Planctomycetales bacterium]|nr:alpha/beta fold hydrolase [Planctomycetales bacterium]